MCFNHVREFECQTKFRFPFRNDPRVHQTVRRLPPHLIQKDYDAPGNNLSPSESLGSRLNSTPLPKVIINLFSLHWPTMTPPFLNSQGGLLQP